MSKPFVIIGGGLWQRGTAGWKWAKTHLVPHQPKPKPQPRPRAITMYDSVTVSAIPKTARAVAGYVGGNWPTYATLEKQFPKAHKLSIAITASEDAECLDVEPGDATIPQAAAWVKRQKARGVTRPVVYTSLSQAQQLVVSLNAAGVTRSQYRLWTAHYTMKAHRCSSNCGYGLKTDADATQYTNTALGRNLDASLCAPGFFT